MSGMTKRTVVVHTKPTLGPHPANAARHEKFAEMFRDGKTNGVGQMVHHTQCNGAVDQILSATVTKQWRDQAAAEEWRDFVVALNQRYDQGLTQVSIEDI